MILETKCQFVMSIDTAPCIVITGAGGALGLGFVQELEKKVPHSTKIVLLTRRPKALSSDLPKSSRKDIIRKIYECDITNYNSLKNLPEQLHGHSKYLTIHAAADVSWSKSFEEMFPVNVGGTLNIAKLANNLGPSSEIIYISTAFTHREAIHFNNEYERTKHMADVAIETDYGHLNPTTFSFSLMIGKQDTGEIARFHGLYPLLKIMALYNPPFFVGNPENRIDLVPMNWVVDELTHLTIKKLKGVAPRDVVVSSDETALPLNELAIKLDKLIGGFRRSLDLPTNSSTPIISSRRYEFLTRSVGTWDTDRSELSQMVRKWKRVANFLTYYTHYLESCDSVQSLNTISPPPDTRTYIDQSFSFWLNQEGQALTKSLLLRKNKT